MEEDPALIIGAGPAGLAAALEMAKRGEAPLILEQASCVGGMARTEVHEGYRFDIGGHRFLTRMPDIQRLWEEALPGAFPEVSRLSHICFEGRFIRYPIEIGDVLRAVGPAEGARMIAGYLRARCRPRGGETTFEEWVSSRFGDRLYERFFKGYTEKVWGVPCNRLRSEMAAERIQGLSLASALTGAVTGRRGLKTLTDRFHYPQLGPGMMWEAFSRSVELQGGEVRLKSPVVRLRLEGRSVRAVIVRRGDREEEIPVSRVLSSMPLRDLVRRMEPAPPAEVLKAAARLVYRDFILVGLVVDRKNLFLDQWIYVHSPEVAVGRIQNFKNWSRDMVPDPDMSSLGMEFFCSRGDGLWERTDQALADLAARDLERLGLAKRAEVVRSAVFRQTEAYPVDLTDTPGHVETLRRFLSRIPNVQTMGRNGLHRYDNQDSAMVTGIRVARRSRAGR